MTMTSSEHDVIEISDSDSGSSRRHTPPPDYTESDPRDKKAPRADTSFGGSSQEKSNKPVYRSASDVTVELPRKRPIAAPTATAAPEEIPGYAKGLVAPEMMAHGDTFGAPAYSIHTDPLLEDNKEAEHTAWVGFLQITVLGLLFRNRQKIKTVIVCLFMGGYTLYLGFAVAFSPYGAIAPLVFTGLAVLFAAYYFVKRHWGNYIYRHVFEPIMEWWDRYWYIFKWFVYPAPLIGLVVLLSVMMTEIRQLQSLSGFVVFFCIIWLTSVHPNKIVWRPILWGYTMQFVMALMVLQWEAGYSAVEWLAGYVATIINFGYQGAAYLYGDPWMLQHAFVMMGMSLLIYVGAVMSVLYYLGITQVAASKLAWAMSAVMGTTAIETLGVTANIMLNGMDVIIMLRAYLMKLTMSEFNCFMVGNNATIAGFMFGLLVLYGAPPQHLLTAAVMSAPASIAIAKLNYPETVPEKSITRDINEVRLSRGPENNLVEACANGSSLAGKTALTVMVNYISFMSMLAFLDACLMWFGERVGFYELSFEWICSYLFFPIALLIGIDLSQCRQIAKVIGLKIFTTEIYAYQVLGDIYEQGLIDDRSKALGTYALCGFCSLSTLAIAVGIWHVLCPPRRPLVSKLMLRVMFEANMSCFTTACVAGLFYSDKLSVFDSAQRTPLMKFVTFVYETRLRLFG